MSTRVAVDDDEQQIADMLKQVRRLRSRLASVTPRGGHDTFTAAATPATTYQLSVIPILGTCLMALNGHVQKEGTDYTCDYGTGLVTVSATQASGDKVVFRYLITDWLVARTLVPDTGLITDNFNRANSATTINPASDGGSWTVDGGTWGITSNQGYNVNATGGSIINGHLIVRRDCGTAVQDFTITNNRNSSDHASALWINYNPSSQSGYMLLLDSTNSFGVLTRVDSGASSSPSVTPVFTTWTGSSAVLRMTSNGAGTIKVYQGGTLKATLTDTTGSPPPLTGTWVGFSTNSNTISGTDKWDDFSAVTA